jgi:hypothetical protein
MVERKSDFFLLCIASACLLFCVMFWHTYWRERTDAPLLLEQAQVVKNLGLNDLCLFTEARYTRHLAVADLNTAFQDYPMSFEHFPSGSLVPVPPHLTHIDRY